jgi:hypothetical protein
MENKKEKLLRDIRLDGNSDMRTSVHKEGRKKGKYLGWKKCRKESRNRDKNIWLILAALLRE